MKITLAPSPTSIHPSGWNNNTAVCTEEGRRGPDVSPRKGALVQSPAGSTWASCIAGACPSGLGKAEWGQGEDTDGTTAAGATPFLVPIHTPLHPDLWPVRPPPSYTTDLPAAGVVALVYLVGGKGCKCPRCQVERLGGMQPAPPLTKNKMEEGSLCLPHPLQAFKG